MKAWHCFSESPEYGNLLVYAENRNRARFLSLRSAWDWDYIYVNAIRANPKFDDLFNVEKIIESNDDLPKTHKFYALDDELAW